MQADAVCPLGEPLVGSIVPELKPVFGTGGEHPVRFINPLRDKVVDHNADVSLVAAQCEWLVGCRPRSAATAEFTLRSTCVCL